MLSADLIKRLKARAADPNARIEAPDYTKGTSLGGGVFKSIVISLDGKRMEGRGPLPGPASNDDVAAAEAVIGVPLPDDLKQVYREVANGGFGPSGGLASLQDAIARYSELTTEPPGEAGQIWPAHLFPIEISPPGADCYDLRSGAIIYWDEMALADGAWKNSFKPKSKDLAEWFESWLGKPSFEDTYFTKEIQEIYIDSGCTIDRGNLEHVRKTLPIIRALPPEERADVGFDRDDWEKTYCQMFGVDPKYLKKLLGEES